MISLSCADRDIDYEYKQQLCGGSRPFMSFSRLPSFVRLKRIFSLCTCSVCCGSFQTG